MPLQRTILLIADTFPYLSPLANKLQIWCYPDDAMVVD